MKKIIIFASGSGSNAENIIRYFNSKSSAKVELVLTNNAKAKIIERCKSLDVSCMSFSKATYQNTNHISLLLNTIKPDIIVLAGFLWKFPEDIISNFSNRIINIHPALLPNYGGKGMYGMHVHNAVISNKEKESGITIHYVNENYDEGGIIFQAKCEISEKDTAEDLASKIHSLEMKHFPIIIETLL